MPFVPYIFHGTGFSGINSIHNENVGKDTHNYIYIRQTDVKNKDYLQFPAHNSCCGVLSSYLDKGKC